MLVADTYLGSRGERELAARIDREGALTVRLDGTERRRSRVRTTTADGDDIGIVTARDLTDGDVLSADGRLVVIELEGVEAMVVDLGDATDDHTAAVALGHAVGNRHWDLAVRDTAVLLPVTDRDRMERTVRPLLPDGATVGYESVSPSLFDDSQGPDHGHGGDDHDHDSVPSVTDS